MGRIPLSRRLALGLALGGSALPAAAQTLPPEPTPQINMVASERAVTPLLEEVTKVGELRSRATAPADIKKLSVRQADALTQLVAAVKADEREPWVKQLADCLQMACCYGPLQDPSAHTRLVELDEHALSAEVDARIPLRRAVAHDRSHPALECLHLAEVADVGDRIDARETAQCRTKNQFARWLCPQNGHSAAARYQRLARLYANGTLACS